ncbi:MAG: hypothetical protein ACYC33_06670 [Thermoleophilia bacterium]
MRRVASFARARASTASAPAQIMVADQDPDPLVRSVMISSGGVIHDRRGLAWQAGVYLDHSRHAVIDHDLHVHQPTSSTCLGQKDTGRGTSSAAKRPSEAILDRVTSNEGIWKVSGSAQIGGLRALQAPTHDADSQHGTRSPGVCAWRATGRRSPPRRHVSAADALDTVSHRA